VCGRATLATPVDAIAELFDAPPIDIGPPRFNIAPTQALVAVRTAREASQKDGQEGGGRAPRELALLRWGLVPWWAKPEDAKKLGSRCVQARAETLQGSPAYRDAFRRHRCLVVIDGFYEWKTLPDGRRVPHHVKRSRGEPFAIAAVWDSWKPAGSAEPLGWVTAERLESCAVVTTRAAGAIREIHDRMPLVLPANDWDTWLSGSVDEAARLLRPETAVLEERASALLATPVSTLVNDVRNDDPRCIEPATLEPDPPPLGQIDFDFAFAGAKAAASAPARKQTRGRRT